MMDMAADHAVDPALSRFAGQLPLERAYEIDRVLDLEFGPGRERPIGQAQPPARFVEMRVDEEREVVGPVAEEGEPFRMTHHDVEFVAMNDKVALAVGGRVNRPPLDLNAPEGQAEELTGELVMVAGHEHHPRAAPDLAQQFLDHVVVRLRPVPAGAEAPAVDDVADQIDGVSLDMTQHVQDKM